MWVTVARLGLLPVTGAVAAPALPARDLRVPEEVVGADVAALPAVARVAVADRLVGGLVQVAALRVAVAGRLDVRTRTGSAWNLGLAHDRVAVVTDLAAFTETEIMQIVKKKLLQRKQY